MNLQFNLNPVAVSVETYVPRIQLELENIMLKQMIKQHAPSLEGHAAVSMESGIWETIKNFFKRIKEWIFGKGKDDVEEIKAKSEKNTVKVDKVKTNLQKELNDALAQAEKTLRENAIRRQEREVKIDKMHKEIDELLDEIDAVDVPKSAEELYKSDKKFEEFFTEVTAYNSGFHGNVKDAHVLLSPKKSAVAIDEMARIVNLLKEISESIGKFAGASRVSDFDNMDYSKFLTKGKEILVPMDLIGTKIEFEIVEEGDKLKLNTFPKFADSLPEKSDTKIIDSLDVLKTGSVRVRKLADELFVIFSHLNVTDKVIKMNHENWSNEEQVKSIGKLMSLTSILMKIIDLMKSNLMTYLTSANNAIDYLKKVSDDCMWLSNKINKKAGKK